MERIIIVSNRLPVGIKIKNNSVHLQTSIGGLATGMKTIYKSFDSLWIGWPGIENKKIYESIREEIKDKLKNEKCIPVHLDKKDIDLYYYGFSNRTIWPLFHYFTQYTEYNKTFWESYKKVNQNFADVISDNIKEGDAIWIHDYHLLLLPKLIREKYPEISIGLFLHIPFPSSEVFRNLPWRNEIIEGMLGADLIGFHTYDYESHFLSCVRRLIGHEIVFNQINLYKRITKVDTFPMGIDYDKFHNASLEINQKTEEEKSDLQKEIDKIFQISPDRKLILSIDRLDYSKGIPNRLYAFEYFLNKYPEFKEKVTMIMLANPTRSNVDKYQLMKSEVDELVGKINGKYSTINWTPIWYFYRSFPFERLIELYIASEIALITPIRDGMNLVAKEFIASKTDRKGVLILSEMAGAAKEMSEALIINPHNTEEIADAIKEALLMPENEQIERNTVLQNRLKRYNIEKWAKDYLNSLEGVGKLREKYYAKKITDAIEEKIINDYKKAASRILFLDYDGTLVGFHRIPESAVPDEELYGILDKLSADSKNKVVLISGRDKVTFASWFGDKNYTLIVEHGMWTKEPECDWVQTEQVNDEWKKIIHPTLEFYVDRTPGTFIEEKNYSLVWHHRKADPELGNLRAIELKDELTSLIANYNLEILEGNKVIEIKNSGINKGRAAVNKIADSEYDFILGIGDDYTDENLFEELPERAVTIKVGLVNTQAKYNVESFTEVRKLLSTMNYSSSS
ncbi:MAG: bifunctional alpha,alpha-trehalose-phosphate synthase (UDP-forming)/trehalose-phosphatase [Bacteroidales bacterium]|nr:bifunctional alpha,alpha-trehalose-phosphate synthase (UDP-forming)/trehalose-phosphatase [Bacteroidales bacterium]